MGSKEESSTTKPKVFWSELVTTTVPDRKPQCWAELRGRSCGAWEAGDGIQFLTLPCNNWCGLNFFKLSLPHSTKWHFKLYPPQTPHDPCHLQNSQWRKYRGGSELHLLYWLAGRALPGEAFVTHPLMTPKDKWGPNQAAKAQNWAHTQRDRMKTNDLQHTFILFIYLFLFLAALGLCYCAWAFSSCSDGGHSSLQCTAFSLWWLLFCGAWALGTWASVVVARGLSSCGSRALERRLSSCGARV